MEITVRLKSFEIENIKNVKHGCILMPDALKKVPDSEEAGVLGIYGQNGSGKTAVIDALYFLRILMAGETVPASFSEFASLDSDTVKLLSTFYLFMEDHVTEVAYESVLERAEKGFIVSHETLSEKDISPDKKGRKNLLLSFERKEEELVLRPEKVLRALYKEDQKNRTELKVALRLSDRENTSFLFSAYLKEMLLPAQDESLSALKTWVNALHDYAVNDMIVVLMEKAGRHQSSFRLTVNTQGPEGEETGSFRVNLDGPALYTAAEKETIQRFAESIDVVLPSIIPGLYLRVRDYGPQVDNSGNESFRLELLSQREDLPAIPLRRESEGIVRIISLLNAFVRAFDDPSVLLAVDELDAGVYEYMLGELLDIFENNARGQLIFTSHNLRALEMLEDKSIMFSTANPENRYIRMKHRDKDMSLRDDYLRGITLGGQDEVIYEETDSLKIARAFRKAAKVRENA